MRRFYSFLVLALLVAGVSVAAYSDEKKLVPEARVTAGVAALTSNFSKGDNCSVKETCTVTTSFSFMENNPRDAKSRVDKKAIEIEELAKKVGVDKFELQNYSFNIYPQNSGSFDSEEAVKGGYRYQVNGSFNYQVSPSDKAIAIMEQLRAKKMQTSLNVNAYRQNCGE